MLIHVGTGFSAYFFGAYYLDWPRLIILRMKADLISRRSSPVRSLPSNVRHVPRSRLSYSVGTASELSSAAIKRGIFSELIGVSVRWMASSNICASVFSAPSFSSFRSTMGRCASFGVAVTTGPVAARIIFAGAGANTLRNLDTSALLISCTVSASCLSDGDCETRLGSRPTK